MLERLKHLFENNNLLRMRFEKIKCDVHNECPKNINFYHDKVTYETCCEKLREKIRASFPKKEGF